MREILLYFAIEYFGDWDKIYSALEQKIEPDYKLVKRYEKEYTNKFITIIDKEYPESLKNVTRPPFVIFYEGDISLLKKTSSSLWVFGSYFLEDQTLFSCLEKKKIIPVSGISTSFEKDFITSLNTQAIIVKDCGINTNLVFDKKIKEIALKHKGLVISEYPGVVFPSEKNWNEANKLKIGMSVGIFLLNCVKTKTMFNLIAQTIEEGKEIYCLKNKKNVINNQNNTLIEKGALAIDDFENLKI